MRTLNDRMKVYNLQFCSPYSLQPTECDSISMNAENQEETYKKETANDTK